MARRPPRSPRPSSAPLDPAAAARQAVVKAFDRQDGHGVNWKLACEALFRASFDVLDALPASEKQVIARLVLAGATDRASGGVADGAAPEQPFATDPGPAGLSPSATGAFNGARPKLPR